MRGTRRAECRRASRPRSRRCSTPGSTRSTTPNADGGRGFDVLQQILVEEQWGSATNALWDIPWRPSIPLANATAEQKERYLLPACRGERRDAYAITEEHAGSDPSMVQTTARRDGDAWVLDGEKWHVTSGDVADFFLVHAHVDGDPAKATVFLVDKDLPGVRLVRTPKYIAHVRVRAPDLRVRGRPRRARRGARRGRAPATSSRRTGSSRSGS